MATPAEQLRLFMRNYPQGVTVVTTTVDGKPYGITVSSFTSVSLDPPLVLISISKTSFMAAVIERTGGFVVNSLTEEQAWLADLFARRTNESWRVFEEVRHTYGSMGFPILADGLGYLECENYAKYDGGDHVLFLGLIRSVGVSEGRRPLVYHNRRYTGLRP